MPLPALIGRWEPWNTVPTGARGRRSPGASLGLQLTPSVQTLLKVVKRFCSHPLWPTTHSRTLGPSSISGLTHRGDLKEVAGELSLTHAPSPVEDQEGSTSCAANPGTWADE